MSPSLEIEPFFAWRDTWSGRKEVKTESKLRSFQKGSASRQERNVKSLLSRFPGQRRFVLRCAVQEECFIFFYFLNKAMLQIPTGLWLAKPSGYP